MTRQSKTLKQKKNRNLSNKSEGKLDDTANDLRRSERERKKPQRYDQTSSYLIYVNVVSADSPKIHQETLIEEMQALKLPLFYCCQYGSIIMQMDVETVFLNGALKSEILVKQPMGYDDKSGKYLSYQRHCMDCVKVQELGISVSTII
ncbi:uncharacterized protein LOC117239779 [Bombus vosnesenskii]|uniref:Uncharacterized protein LOC117239779 n=1 Tax=Bombus vosnesenskii TaxID=207650 RepID=A0A6J3L851_9HYME|nr:uncharacterized protein LOC117239779 [Bombus vosnesenskii]